MLRTNARAWTTAAVLSGAAVALAACGGASNAQQDPALPTTTTTGQVAAAPTPTMAQSQTPEALAFKASTVDGAAFDAASLSGKPVVFWFWAPWCTVCRAESPDVAKVAAELKGKVTFIGIAGLGSVPDMQAFVFETGTGDFIHLADSDGSLWARFGVVAQPSFVFVTPSGQVQEFTGGSGLTTCALSPLSCWSPDLPWIQVCSHSRSLRELLLLSIHADSRYCPRI